MAYFNNKQQENATQAEEEEQQIEEEEDEEPDDESDSSEESGSSKMPSNRSIIKKLTNLEKAQKLMKQQLDEMKTDVKQILRMMKDQYKSRPYAFGSPSHSNKEDGIQSQHSDPVPLGETITDSVVHLARRYVEVYKILSLNLIFLLCFYFVLKATY